MAAILVVDDEKAIRGALADTLSFLGHEVATANNGTQGLRLFFKDSFELVVTDMQMPGLDGWTLAQRIKTTSPNTPVILITGSEKEMILKKLKGNTIDSVLFKPFTLQELEHTIQGILDNTVSPLRTSQNRV
jgi:two-component system OmpR family response regulator